MYGIMCAALLSSETTITAASLDFTDVLTSALNGISSDYAKYVMIAVPVAIGIWAGPKVIKMIMKFFNALTH